MSSNKMFSQVDRDLLIQLNTKFDSLTHDVKVMGEGMRSRMTNVETRVAAIEREHIEVNPAKTYERFVKVEEGYKRIKIIMWVVGVIAAIISWTTGALNEALTLFNR